MLGHALLDQLDAALAEVLPSADVGLSGEWSSRVRRAYQSGSQLGSGEGPYVEVVDHVWDGRLGGAFPLTGMAFLLTGDGLYWAKAAHMSQEVVVRVSLSGHADYIADRMTFSVSLDDVVLPGVPVDMSSGQPRECVIATDVVPTGRVACVARSDGKAFFLLLLSGTCVKFGRNRLWRLRESFAVHLPPNLRELLTRRRAGAEPG
jgi:hypothetical protein